MKTIPLTQGQVALVDDADFEAVSQFKWCAHKIMGKFYAARNVRKPDGKFATQHMHKFLMPGVLEVDHRDGNGLNNRREGNLRPATKRQNQQGFRREKIKGTSKFRGVCWNKRESKWESQIVDGRRKFLGYFDNEIDAAKAYDAAAKKYFGEFADLNFP